MEDPIVLTGPGGMMFQLAEGCEAKLLEFLLDRAHERVQAESEAEPVDPPQEDLLAARAHAIRSGLVPVQNVRPKRTTEEKIQALRARSRAMA